MSIIRKAVLAAAWIGASALPAMAQQDPTWTEAFPPFHIAGNLYYVGTRGLASYLIKSSDGLILINSDLQENVPQIKASIEQLGLKFSDVKVLLISHAHWDHDAGSAKVKAMTGAKYMVMDADVPVVESGGKEDFRYSDAKYQYAPTKVDRVLHDGDEVRLGDATLVAHKTPGHTKGCTTWTLKVKEGAKTYDVVIVGSPNTNDFKLVKNEKYPTIAQDFEKGFRVLESLPCDIFLGAHGAYFNMDAKYPKFKAGDASVWVDPAGYKAYVEDREKAFRTELAKQSGG